MDFHRFDRRLTASDRGAIRGHWESLSWTPMTSTDEASVLARWIEALQPDRAMVFPSPRRRLRLHDLRKLAGHDQDIIEADLTLKFLVAFRRITPRGERLLAIDWQHQSYFFDPHGGVATASRDEWAIPIVPDIDSYHFMAPNFRFGVSGDCLKQRLIVFGQELLDGLELYGP